MILKKLNSPYPINFSIPSILKNNLLYGLFVFLFLYIFQPFNIGSIKNNFMLICLGYGFVTSFVMTTYNLTFIYLFSIFSDESNWTTGKEIIQVLLNITLIGLGNLIYSNLIGISNFSLRNLMFFEFYTLAVGVFPTAFSVFYKQKSLNEKYAKGSEIINLSIQKNEKTNTVNNEKITVFSENKNEDFELLADELVFLKAADNYVEVNFLKAGNYQKRLVRNSLKNIQNALSEKIFFRCHKSYIINLNHVAYFSGNAQGYKLHLDELSEIIPVSRNHNETIKKLFDSHP